MLKQNIQRLLDLCDLPGLAAHEDRVRAYIKTSLDELGITYQFDTLGSVIAHIPAQEANAPKVMFSAHMDEVGFLVRSIDKNGAIHVMTLGGVQLSSTKLGTVKIITKTSKFPGIILNASDTTNDALVDCGFDSLTEAVDAGIQIGDMVVFDAQSTYLNQNGRVLAKALDDRIGVFTLLELASLLVKECNRPNDIYLTFSSSEEVGTRGGKTAAALINPDLFIAVDVASKDIPGSLADVTNKRQLGRGPMLVMYDKTLSPSPRLLELIEQILTLQHIAFQEDMFAGGGTDAAQASLTGSGILSAVLGIPLRFCHGPRSIADVKDIEGAIHATLSISLYPLKDSIEELHTF